jgi:hypothetical protein
VSGGASNTASGDSSTVGGVASNTASSDDATVSGGDTNTASGSWSTVIGGWHNQAGGQFATVLGGKANSAAGDYATAAGCGAYAGSPGSTVWVSEGQDQVCTFTQDNDPNSFTVRANGGFYFYTSFDETNLGAVLSPGRVLGRP